jgi:hypothetical protein
MAVFSTPGNYFWTCPSGVTKVMVEVWGAGGGGWGQGGQGGGYAKSFVTVSSGSIISVDVGNGGCTTWANGCTIGAAAGGDSKFGNVIAYGGNGAQSSIVNKVTSNGQISISGQNGLPFYSSSGNWGGGASFQGSPSGIAQNGFFPGGGAGGGGGGCNSTITCGAKGQVIIYY